MCLSIEIRSHVLILSSILKFVTINPIKENLFVSVLPIIEYPDQILRKTAKPVVNFDKSLTNLVEDMINTLHDSQGIGLAANQIGVLLRIIVLQMPDENDPRVFINPEIIDHDGNRKVVEGCLSVPGYHGYVFRSLWVKAVGLNNKSEYTKLYADGLLAQALEHETDHLNGIMYFDHLRKHEDLIKNPSEQK